MMLMDEKILEVINEKSQLQQITRISDNFYSIFVSGDLYTEPFIHIFPTGKCVCIFSIGHFDTYSHISSEGDEISQFHCAAYNDLGRTIYKQFNLGDRISVKGQLKYYTNSKSEIIYDLIISEFWK